MSIQIIIALLLGAAAYKFSDWRSWKLFYSTMLFIGFGDLMYRFIFADKPLWLHYSRYLTEKQTEAVWILAIYPSMILLFFTFYLKQKSLKKQTLYHIYWILACSVLELGLNKLGCIIYKNGWNYYWSVTIYFFMFPIITLHYFKPLLANLVSAICGFILMYIFLGNIIA